tara:strand:- start:513 stop:2123 length:1611 start_codon:yes stop_codon:yes gene_type:complete
MNKKNIVSGKINLLDCTFRDGGYYNNWNFEKKLVNKYLHSMGKINISIIELGFRFLSDDKKIGDLGKSTDSYIDDLNLPKKVRLAVMINAKEYISFRDGVQHAIDLSFSNRKKSKVELVRVAIHIDDALSSRELIDKLNDLGYNVILNLMQASSVSNGNLKNIAQKISKWNNLEALYFADSFGDMDPQKVIDIVGVLKKNFKKPLGFHAHNNKGFALINSLTAIKHGVSYIDSTIMGMGRGAGNTQTENLLLELQSLDSKERNLDHIFPLILREFSKLKKKYNWGTNIYYYLAAEYNIHPTYIQKMLDDSKYENEGIMGAINFLKNKESSSYNDENMIEAFTGKIGSEKGKWSCKNFSKGRDILLIGAGKSIKKNIHEVENFINKKNPQVISININHFLDHKFIDAFIACNDIRILLECYEYKEINKPIILPINRLEKEIKKELKNSKIFDYGLKIGPKNFEFNNYGCINKEALGITYALSFANASGAKKIYLAGMDGYSKGDPNQLLIEEIFNEYDKNNLIPIKTITKSKYKALN